MFCTKGTGTSVASVKTTVASVVKKTACNLKLLTIGEAPCEPGAFIAPFGFKKNQGSAFLLKRKALKGTATDARRMQQEALNIFVQSFNQLMPDRWGNKTSLRRSLYPCSHDTSLLLFFRHPNHQ